MFEFLTNKIVSVFLLFIIFYSLFNYRFVEGFQCSWNVPETQKRKNRRGQDEIDILGTNVALANWKAKCEQESQGLEAMTPTNKIKKNEKEKILKATRHMMDDGQKKAFAAIQKVKTKDKELVNAKVSSGWKPDEGKGLVNAKVSSGWKPDEGKGLVKTKDKKLDVAAKKGLEQIVSDERVVAQKHGLPLPAKGTAQPADANDVKKMMDTAKKTAAKKETETKRKEKIKQMTENMGKLAAKRAKKAQFSADQIINQAMASAKESLSWMNKDKKPTPLIRGLGNQNDGKGPVGANEQQTTKHNKQIQKLAAKLPCEKRCEALYKEEWGEKYRPHKCEGNKCKCIKKDNGMEIAYSQGKSDDCFEA